MTRKLNRAPTASRATAPLPQLTKAQIRALVLQLDAWEQAYRVGKPIVSDAKFDAALDQLRAASPNHPRLTKIGAAKETPAGRKAKVRLPFTIGSLDKLRPSDVSAWMKEIVAKQPQPHGWLIEPKFDGQSVTLRYLNRGLDRALSRGRDGVFGQNVTAAARYIQGVRPSLKPTKLFPVDEELQVRGEVVMHRSIFREFYKDQKSELGREYVSERNMVCGLTNRIDPEPVAPDLRRCTFIALQLFRKNEKGEWVRPTSAHREWVYLSMLGFTTALHPVRYSPGHSKIAKLVKAGHAGLKPVLPVHDEGDTIGHLSAWDSIPTEDEVKQRFSDMQKAIDVRIDGLVIQPIDNAYWQKRKDHLAPRPEFIKAVKLEAHEQESMDNAVGEIEWNVSKRGLLKPRLILASPVQADGAEVNHATCNNARFVKDWGLRKGRPIRIVRSGDVIPRIIGVKDGKTWVPVRIQDAGIKDPKIDASLPSVCPSCGTKTRWNTNKVDLVCPNEQCPGRHSKSVLAFFRTLKVDDVAAGTVGHLIEAGLNTVPKILNGASPMRLMKMEGYQQKMADKVSRSISGALAEKPLYVIMHASGFFQNETFSLGSTKLQVIVDALGPGMVERATPPQIRTKLRDVNGIGSTTVETFVDGLTEWREFYASVRKHHTVSTGPATLAGTVVAFTSFRDSDMEAYVLRHGGRVGGVSKNCDVLFAASLGSTKCAKADKLGIPVVAQSEAWDWLRSKGGGK